jgi:hypothetical protein
VAATAILWPVAAHLALVAVLYAWLTVERRLAVKRGDADMASYRAYETEPLRGRLLANNLANQFELPVLFYAVAMTLYVINDVSRAQVVLAWVFVAGRWAHTFVHVLSPNVALRGNVFTVGFVAVGAMWALFLAEKLLGMRI